MTRLRVLSIAGADPSGGAGTQADMKAFDAFGCHGLPVCAALTVQSTRGVHAVESVSATLIRAQLEALFEDGQPAAAKTGMLLTADAVDAVADTWEAHPGVPLVVDPVLRSSGGVTLLEKTGLRALIARVLPLAALVTPNALEAKELTGIEILDAASAEVAARRLLAMGVRAVLVKGGHVDTRDVVVDVLVVEGSEPVMFERPRVISTRRVHGTGCALSAAIAACLALGMDLRRAVEVAGDYVHAAIRGAYEAGPGSLVLDLSQRVPGKGP